MDARMVLRRAWNDSVWSKVIAAAITAALAGAASLLTSSWESLEASRHQLETPVTLPAWSLAALALVMAVLVGLSCRKRHNTNGADDVQPNAVPVVEARLFACPLEAPTPSPAP